MVNQDLIAEDTPKLQEFLQSIKQVTNEIIPLISKLSNLVDDGNITIKNGVSLLDVKNEALLAYMIDLVTLVLSKVNGASIVESDSVNRIVEHRTVLEKLRPLEQKLKYQIDKVIQASTAAAALNENNPLSYKPNLDNFGDSDDDDDNDDDSDDEAQATLDAMKNRKYVPPHIAAVRQEEANKTQAQLEQAKRKALTKSSVIADLIADSSDRPIEYSQQSQFQSRATKMQEERRQYEEANLTRLTLSKKQKAIEKKLMRKSELDTITSFGNIDVLHNNELEPSKKRKKKHSTKSKKRRKK